MPSRYMHLFNAARAIPLGRKSVTRNGWANFLFHSAPGLAPPLYSYIIHLDARYSCMDVRTFTGKYTERNFEMSSTRESPEIAGVGEVKVLVTSGSP